MSPMARRRARRDRGRVPTWFLSGLLALFIVGLGVSYAVVPTPPALDDRSCRPHLAGLTQVFVDTTDPLTPRQAAAVDRIVEEAYRQAEPWALLEVGTLGADWDGLWTPSLARCRSPLTAQESGSGGTSRHFEREYRRLVRPKLNLLGDELRAAGEAQSSPVFEGVAKAAAAGSKQGASGERRLIVVSDFLEATRDFAERRNAGLTAKSVALPVFSGIKADLAGVRVQLYELERSRAPGLQTAGHRAFVKAWFEQRGAIVDDDPAKLSK